jgi:transposase
MKAFSVVPSAKVYVYSKPMHMGCSFPKLVGLVDSELKTKLKAGDLFVFTNKKLTYVKILFWSKGGPCIFAKQLEHGVFKISRTNGETLSIKGLENVIEHQE